MSKSSRAWLQRQELDPYVKRARKEGFRSRAVYKLEELNRRDRLLKSGMRIVDLGAAPGGWSQWAQRFLQGKTQIIALDILEMESLPGVTFIQGDFTEENVLQELISVLDKRPLDLVMSDMAPNISGMKAVDQPRAMLLAELAADFALQNLKPGGDFITKVFHGEGFEQYIKDLRKHFTQMHTRKPQASRAKSREVYVVAKNRI